MKDRSRHASGRRPTSDMTGVRAIVTTPSTRMRKQNSGLTIPVRLMQLPAVVCGAAYLKSRADEPTGMPRWPDAPGWR